MKTAIAILLTLYATPVVAYDAGSIRKISELLAPELAQEMSDWKRAKMLRDMVHRHSVQSVSSVKHANTAEFNKYTQVFKHSLMTRSRANSCQGLGFLYMIALRAYGLENRMIQMFSSRTAAQPVWSHASVDVLINGRWTAMDPTMNVSLRDHAGGLLSWPEALERAQIGDLVIPRTDGAKVKKSMSWGAVTGRLGYRLKDFSRQYIIGMSKTSDIQVRGKNWNGKIDFLAGPAYDAGAAAQSDFYIKLTGK